MRVKIKLVLLSSQYAIANNNFLKKKKKTFVVNMEMVIITY